MEDKQRPTLTPEQKEQVSLMLTSLNAFAPNVAAIREALQTLGHSMDPRAAYEEFERMRPKEWPGLPTFGQLMGKDRLPSRLTRADPPEDEFLTMLRAPEAAPAQEGLHTGEAVEDGSQAHRGEMASAPKSRWMGRFLLIVAVAVAIGAGGYLNQQERAKRADAAALHEASERDRHDRTVMVQTLARGQNASVDWASKLPRFSRILTADLQDLWPPDRPILFVGHVRDIARNGDGSLQVQVFQNSLDGLLANDQTADDLVLGPELRLNLRCDVLIAGPILERLRRAKATPYLNSGVAVIALIESIETTQEHDADSSTTVLTGKGKCLDALYLEGGLAS